MNIILGKLKDYEGCANTLTGYGMNTQWDIITNDLLIAMLRKHENKEKLISQTYNYEDENTIEEVQKTLIEYNIISEEDI